MICTESRQIVIAIGAFIIELGRNCRHGPFQLCLLYFWLLLISRTRTRTECSVLFTLVPKQSRSSNIKRGGSAAVEQRSSVR